MTDQRNYERFWEEAIVRLLHPTQLLIIEALARLDHPISPTIMARISDGQVRLNNYDYHCKRLVKLGLLESAGQEPRRGAWEHFYALSLDGHS